MNIIWKKLEDNWEEYFPELDVLMNITIKIRNTGMIIEPVL
ncbi:Ger(x)C family spore germination C-terminal domain-containing protein [Paenibacillus marchantiophytorum]